MHRDDSKPGGPPVPVKSRNAALLVDLCAEQIQAAISEASSDIEALSLSVLDTARHADKLIEPDRSGPGGETSAGQGPDSGPLKEAVRNASQRLQFADRLSQRLSNTAANLAALADFMQADEQPVSDEGWSAFLDAARARFTMEQERRMFDAIFGTAPSVEAVDAKQHAAGEHLLFDVEGDEPDVRG